MKIIKLPFYSYFIYLFCTQVIVLLLLGELKIYSIPFSSTMLSTNDLFVIFYSQGFDFFQRFKYLYMYYIISYFCLSFGHSILLLLILKFKNKVLKIFIYIIGIIIFSIILFFFHRLDLYRFFMQYINALVHHFKTICLFIFVNFVFSLFFKLQSLTISTSK